MKTEKNIKEKFSVLIQSNQGIIHKVTRIYVDDPSDREDLFQEICFQLWKSYPQLKNKKKFSSWMYRVALNTAISLLRSRTKSIHTEKLDSAKAIAAYSENIPDNAEKLYWAISRLSSIDKAIILLWLEDHSYEEISSIIGINKNNISVRLVRIKKKITSLIFNNKNLPV